MHNTLNEDSEKQDQSQKTAMEDSSMMTIEFLRARLLSERSVSKSARERADELANRVAELEEQLKLVTFQRKKAEKAAAEVLAILESNEVSDFSDANDSSSDQEGIVCESKEGNNSIKEDNSFSTLGLSGWDREGSPSTHRSLSWKSCTGSDCLEKKKRINQARRRSRSVSIGGSSTKQLLGKSCRQIKRRETRSALAEVRDESLLQENGKATGFGDFSDEKDRPEILEEGSKADRRKEINASRRDADMERALEDQAMLIGRYEAEENAQREWEEMFRENNSCTLDSCEPGSRSDITDITEERDIRTETVESAQAILSHREGATSELEDVCHSEKAITETLPNDFMPTSTLDTGFSQDQQSNSSIGNGVQTGFPEFSFPQQEYTEAKENGKKELDWPENNSSHPTSCGSSEHQLAQTYPTFHSGRSFYKGGSTGSQNELQVATHHEASNRLGDVLESLQRAKLSLKHEISRSPSANQRMAVVRATETPSQAIRAANAMQIPIECAGLFRVPTVLQPEATSRPNVSGTYSDSGSSLTRQYYPDTGVGFGTGGVYASSSNLETGSRISSLRPYYDYPYLDIGAGLPSSSDRYATYPSYADVMLRMPTNDGFRRPYSSMGSPGLLANDGFRRPYSSMGSPGLPAEDLYLGYSDQIRSNMRG
ncbi:hypothetical protein BVC80_1707g60 [Macleaya cordata]|uniref:Uncharacterized protein n=1 Tax=Macleaya cordata TaxID=56857 RepID=A0A200Q643_MACCD|nr:hypothetical protein BVC80_1707g60 [Macleaya cordata]